MDAAQIFRDEGYRVLEAADATQAMEFLERHNDIKLLFTDVDMPGLMNGLQLAEEARRRWPPIGLVVVSGRCDITAETLPAGAVFLAKPYLSEVALQITEQLTA